MKTEQELELDPKLIIAVLRETVRDLQDKLQTEHILVRARNSEVTYARAYSDQLNKKLEDIRQHLFSETLTPDEKVKNIEKVFIVNSLDE